MDYTWLFGFSSLLQRFLIQPPMITFEIHHCDHISHHTEQIPMVNMCIFKMFSHTWMHFEFPTEKVAANFMGVAMPFSLPFLSSNDHVCLSKEHWSIGLVPEKNHSIVISLKRVQDLFKAVFMPHNQLKWDYFIKYQRKTVFMPNQLKSAILHFEADFSWNILFQFLVLIMNFANIWLQLKLADLMVFYIFNYWVLCTPKYFGIFG